MNNDSTLPSSFPGGSKSRVNRAGENVRNKKASKDDLFVIDQWRAAHRAVLNTFQAILRTRTRQTRIVVAQRHKRKSTIIGKLDRLPGMNLSRMDDVAGFRLIFPTIKQLYKICYNLQYLFLFLMIYIHKIRPTITMIKQKLIFLTT